MTKHGKIWLYNPRYSYADNIKLGPFGNFSDLPTYKNRGEPRYDFFGTKVYSPFGIAAGPLPHVHFVQAALDRGFDLVTFKSVRSRTYPCHPVPNVIPLENKKIDPTNPQAFATTQNSYNLPLTLANSFGIPSFDPSVWQPAIRKSFSQLNKGQAMLAAFQGTIPKDGDFKSFIDDHIEGIKLLSDTGAKVIEVNLSCPNEGHSNLLCYDIKNTKQIIEEIRKNFRNIKLVVKIAYFQDDKLLEKFVKEIGPLIDGITAINTVAAKITDASNRSLFPESSGISRDKPGVSGYAIKHLGLDMVSRLNKYRDKFGLSYKIIGVGGVQTAGDFHEYRKVGADIVMALTGAMWNPYLAEEIKKSLVG